MHHLLSTFYLTSSFTSHWTSIATTTSPYFSFPFTYLWNSHLSSIHFRFDFRFHLHSRWYSLRLKNYFLHLQVSPVTFLCCQNLHRTSLLQNCSSLCALPLVKLRFCLERQLTCFTSQLVSASHSLQISNDVEYYLTSCLISPHFRLVSSFNQLQASLHFT